MNSRATKETANRPTRDHLVLVVTSPRLPPGLLSWQAWQALRSGQVYSRDSESAQAVAVRSTGIEITQLSGETHQSLAEEFRRYARDGRTAVWLTAPDGDPAFMHAVSRVIASQTTDTTQDSADLEVIYGSWDPPGARLLDVVSVMDRLRSPGGCPWCAEQTSESLMPYLLEEAYEAYQALADGDLVELREELGDVLLQVIFNARVGEEADQPWSIDDVAEELVAKLIRRHPHVFADRVVSDARQVEQNWDAIKRTEKPRDSITDGIPLAQPALQLASALLRRAAKINVPTDLLPSGDDLGHRLFSLVQEAQAANQDSEAALRQVIGELRKGLVGAEQRAKADDVELTSANPQTWRRYWPKSVWRSAG